MLLIGPGRGVSSFNYASLRRCLSLKHVMETLIIVIIVIKSSSCADDTRSWDKSATSFCPSCCDVGARDVGAPLGVHDAAVRLRASACSCLPPPPCTDKCLHASAAGFKWPSQESENSSFLSLPWGGDTGREEDNKLLLFVYLLF